MSPTREIVWEPLPRSAWTTRVRLCRRLGREHSWTSTGLPLSDYEPCERCGVRVIGAALPSGERAVIELTAVRGDRDRETSALQLDGRRHRCLGAA